VIGGSFWSAAGSTPLSQLCNSISEQCKAGKAASNPPHSKSCRHVVVAFISQRPSTHGAREMF